MGELMADGSPALTMDSAAVANSGDDVGVGDYSATTLVQNLFPSVAASQVQILHSSSLSCLDVGGKVQEVALATLVGGVLDCGGAQRRSGGATIAAIADPNCGGNGHVFWEWRR
ncbi:hypothetical protein Droror1_Dr00007848 [Drosera rotundifolia]